MIWEAKNNWCLFFYYSCEAWIATEMQVFLLKKKKQLQQFELTLIF